MIDLTDHKSIKSQNTSSKGNQFKWKVDGYWYKSDFLGYEGLSEVIASDILRCSNIQRFCEYEPELIKYNGTIRSGCKSRDFLNEGESLITLEQLGRLYKDSSIGYFLSGHYMTEDKIKIILDFLASLGISGVQRYITAIIEFDALILNVDRHTQNIVFLRNEDGLDTGVIFDNGAAFLSDTSEYQLGSSIEGSIRRACAKPFSHSFDIQKKILEEQFGYTFRTSYDKSMLRSSLDKCAGFYTDDILKRVEDIVTLQLERYPELRL